VRLSYDQEGDRLYIDFTAKPVWNVEGSALMLPPSQVGTVIHLHFDKDERLIALDIQDASTKLPPELLAEAEPWSPPFPEGKPP
jgi:uncharacterized protein YuzE